MDAGEMLSSIGVLAVSVVIIALSILVISLAVAGGLTMIRGAWHMSDPKNMKNKNLEDPRG